MTSVTEITSSNTRVIVASLLTYVGEEQDLEQEDVDAAVDAAKRVLASRGYSVGGNSSVVNFQRVTFKGDQVARLIIDCNIVIDEENQE